jgi:hypothetical protein
LSTPILLLPSFRGIPFKKKGFLVQLKIPQLTIISAAIGIESWPFDFICNLKTIISGKMKITNAKSG